MTKLEIPPLDSEQRSLLQSSDQLVEWGCPREIASRLCREAFDIISPIVDSLNELDADPDLERQLLGVLVASGLINIIDPKRFVLALQTPLMAHCLSIRSSGKPEKDQ